MATERQIAANRRNARKSTGPRTRAGKKRARRNSYRHGLSYGAAGAVAFARHIEALAKKIAGRSAAAATLEIRQIKRIQNLIDGGLPWDSNAPAPTQMPSSEPEHSTEAMRRALPELLKLDRYERRATARRDRAMHQLTARNGSARNF
jgi:hypothetical protein